MSETKNTIEGQPQLKIRDRLFIAIFGEDDDRSKRWRLDLYNTLCTMTFPFWLTAR